jgi:hypothetical protein
MTSSGLEPATFRLAARRVEFDAAVDGKHGHQALYEMLSSINRLRCFDVVPDKFGVAGMWAVTNNESYVPNWVTV